MSLCILRLLDEQRLHEVDGRLVQPLQFLLCVADVNLGDVEKGLLLIGSQEWRHASQHHVGKDTDTPTRKKTQIRENEISIPFYDDGFQETELAGLLYVLAHTEKVSIMPWCTLCSALNSLIGLI